MVIDDFLRTFAKKEEKDVETHRKDTLFCLMYIVARLTDCAIDTSVRWTIS